MTEIPTTTTDLANIPCPAGATYVAEWDDPRYPDPTAPRYFRGTQWLIDRTDDPYNPDLVVEIWGTQSRERAVERHVDVLDKRRYEQLTFSSAGHARQFGEALIAAADETRAAGKLRSDHGLQQLVFRL